MQSEVVVDDGPPPTVRVPDVLVGPSADIAANLPPWNAREVLLVVEVLADGTRRTDRRTKFFEYAAAGIRHYWLVDLEPVGVTAYTLIDGGYQLAANTSDAVALELAETTVTLDPEALTSSRAGR
ncbi:Uma2 family endonuclease [Nocardia sp. CY41]|uniref:Uma2 family endonuclease n=1 Tax=Nocardia sp. CY41 TaxID=2608686 RepID=UPI001359EF59|nr:Uma2 family endonuclease [Nocardia sp. CY41]